MTQTERILARLKAGPMCSLEPLDWEPRITRTAARIQDLRDSDVEIITTTCRRHHTKANHVVYELTMADQGVLFS